MGLCKCPQRKVSTLFCFKHHVNVCESCLVQEHPQCIVRSYVSWLQDNDYNPNCSMCQQSLNETADETIRLVCYDLFHWSCLDQYFRSFPSHTAPDGYTCPTCHTCIFPPKNLVSPVADHVREKLASVNWATSLSSLATNDSSTHPDKQKSITQTEKNGYVIVNSSASEPTVDRGMSGLSHHPHRTTDAVQGSTMLTLKVRVPINALSSSPLAITPLFFLSRAKPSPTKKTNTSDAAFSHGLLGGYVRGRRPKVRASARRVERAPLVFVSLPT